MPEIKKEAADLNVLLCYQVSPAGIIGLFSKLIYKIPLITWVRAESEYTSLLRKVLFTPLLLRFSDKFIVQTKKIKRDIKVLYSKSAFLHKNQLENIKVIPNGIEIDCLSVKAAPHREGILYVGRLDKIKGISYLITAMKGIEDRLTVIGSGPEQERLTQLSAGLNVEFLGELSQAEVFLYLRRAKVLVLPSLSESFPNVILEAMGAGLPVIATRVGGVEDVVVHGKTGFLVEPRNIEELRKFTKILLKDDELWAKMSRDSLEDVKKYSWPNIVQSLEEILFEIDGRVFSEKEERI
jgi:hypothetical protein